MGRLSVVNFVSIDGVIQSPLAPDEDRDGGFSRGGWASEHGDEVVDGFMESVTTGAAGLLLGRLTYDILAAAWSTADELDPAVAAMNRMPKHVVTSSPTGLDWVRSHRVEGDLAPAVTALVAQTEGDLVVLGSGVLVQSLAAHDLVDTYRLLLFPVVLGTGKRMFSDASTPRRFTLADSVVSPRGVAIHTFSR